MIEDRDQRQQAVTTDGHAFVQASAGTGKTHTLTLRALFLLLLAPFEKQAAGMECARLYSAATRVERLRAAQAVIRRYVLTTFTRKAAAEMQMRLCEYLHAVARAQDFEDLKARVATMNKGHGDDQFIEVVERALAKTGGFEPLRKGAEALAELATELQVCTLHSFAAAMLRRHPIAAGIPPTARFAEEDDATTPDVCGLVIERWWQHVLADDALHDDLRELIKTLSLADIQRWLGAIFENRWIVDEVDFGKPNERAVREILEACDALVCHPDAMELKDIVALREVLTAKPFSWTALCGVIHEKRKRLFEDQRSKSTPKGILTALSALPSHLRRYFESQGVLYPHLLAKCLAEEHSENWLRWQRFVGRFAAWVEDAAVKELGIVTFDDMVRLAAKLLRTNEDVRSEERKRLWGILVDEFQDTDPVQLDLLGSLLRRESKDDHEVIGFFVWDPKQSIYRFRDADLPAIQEFVKNYAGMVRAPKSGAQAFQLTASFRSLRPITDFVNHLFDGPVALPNYVSQKLSPVRKDVGERAEWRLLRENPEANSAAQKREFAAWETARLIKEYTRDAGGGDKAYSDIVVLVNTHNEMDTLLPVLQEAGIPVVSSGARTFYSQPEVLDALNLLIALHNPQDTLAAGALLRSPLFGLSDAQIHRLFGEIDAEKLFHGAAKLPESISADTRTQIEMMRKLVSERATTTLAEWLGRVNRFIPAGVYAQQDAEGRAVVRIGNVLSAFRGAVELGSIPPLAWLLEQRARADRSDDFDADLGEDVSITDESMAAVRAMTIHKAKGLQGKCVIVYGWQTILDRREPKPLRGKEPISLTDSDGNIVRGYQLPWGPLLVVSPDYALADRLEQNFHAEEARRLAYVAATRAQDRLFLLSFGTEEISDGMLAEAKAVLDGGAKEANVFGGTLIVRRAESRKGEKGGLSPSKPVADAKAYARLWRARATEMERPLEPLLHKPSRAELLEEKDAADQTDYVSSKARPPQDTARLTGIVAHRFLEQNLLDEKFDDEKLAVVVSLMADEPPGADAVENAKDVLKNFFRSERPLRARRSKILGRETPVFLTHTGKAWSGVIDLVMEEGDAIVGVDYKAAKEPSALPEEYLQQEKVYTEALRRLFPGKKVRFEFWWLLK